MSNNTDIMPDFIIAGAMKCGTSSLHYILNQHDQIFIPDKEIFFFDIDDIEQHPDFFVETPEEWFAPNYELDFNKYLAWYKAFFINSNDSQLIGEDSTTYIASKKAPYRIFSLIPDVKLIFILRDPVMRTYSHYWHLVRTGRTIYNFEKTIQYMPGNLLQRSFYKEQIERYTKIFPRKNIKFIIFEDFKDNPQRIVDEIFKFLEMNNSIDIQKINTHKNAVKIPRSQRLQFGYNLFFRNFVSKKHLDFHLPSKKKYKLNNAFKIIDKMFKKVNLVNNTPPSMKPHTMSFLQDLFAKENRGLQELIDINLENYWTYMK